MTALTPSTLLRLNAENVRIVRPIGVSVFTGNKVHVFAMPAEPAKLKAFCWANHIPFEGNVEDSTSGTDSWNKQLALQAKVQQQETARHAAHMSDINHH